MHWGSSTLTVALQKGALRLGLSDADRRGPPLRKFCHRQHETERKKTVGQAQPTSRAARSTPSVLLRRDSRAGAVTASVRSLAVTPAAGEVALRPRAANLLAVPARAGEVAGTARTGLLTISANAGASAIAAALLTVRRGTGRVVAATAPGRAVNRENAEEQNQSEHDRESSHGNLRGRGEIDSPRIRCK